MKTAVETIKQACSLGELGIAYYRKGQVEIAKSKFQEALGCLRDHHSFAAAHTLAVILNQIGNIYHQYERDYGSAMQFYHKALRVSETLGEPLGIAVCLTNIAGCAMEFQRFEEALDYHCRSLEIERKLSRKEGIANSLNWIGRLHHVLGDHPRAIACYQESLTICRELGNTWQEASVVGNMGLLARDAEDYRQAAIHFGHVIRLLPSTTHPMKAMAIEHLEQLRAQCGYRLVDRWIKEG